MRKRVGKGVATVDERSVLGGAFSAKRLGQELSTCVCVCVCVCVYDPVMMMMAT